MFRPPAREMCLNTLEDVYQTCKTHLAPRAPQQRLLTKNFIDEESRPAAGKVLARWRPQALPAPAETTPAPAPAGAVESAPAAPQAEVQAPAAST